MLPGWIAKDPLCASSNMALNERPRGFGSDSPIGSGRARGGGGGGGGGVATALYLKGMFST